MKNFYLTTAIDYANGAPHIGHAYEKILSDAIIRSRRLEGMACHFLTGLDEHGQKVQETADKQGVEPEQLCDGVAEKFQALCRNLNISNDDYIRTTQRRHTEVVGRILMDFHGRGEIYKAEYRGLYSVRAERFVLERDRIDGHWPEDFGEVVELCETNYFFRLSKYQDWLIDFLRSHEDFIFPDFRRKQVLEFLREPLNDLCISRPKARLRWGIELPFDGDYVTYVWFDALINYISAVGYGSEHFSDRWPADIQVIGKDILVPAHAVYWPIMLHAAGIPPPRKLLVHGWWLVRGGEKMSKSLGNVVNPLDYAGSYGADAFRYFVLREMVVGQDSNFTHELFLSHYTADLADDLGNLLSRLIHMLGRYCGGIIPAVELEETEEKNLRSLAETAISRVRIHCGSYEFSLALEAIFELVRETNRYVERRSPWKLAQNPAAGPALRSSLATAAEALRIGAALLIPVMPGTAEKIFRQLGADPAVRWLDLCWGTSLAGKKLGAGEVLFPKILEANHALPQMPA
ncbi:MAG: class I tRNA ligase family protein [Puniceicoccales bacterium]|jgi:methionyl-tRNA synthetase|nr:class I tRNA ligase family protein [Puniceicoccales bacterium]